MAKPYRSRLQYLSQFILPSDGTKPRNRLNEFVGKGDSKHIESIKQNYMNAVTLVELQQTNGSSLSASRALREFLLEYNNRSVHYGMHTQPSSFNILEAFVQFLPALLVFRLRPEQEFLLPLTGFFDYYTSRDTPDDYSEVVGALPEQTVFSFNNLDPLQATLWTGEDGRKYVLSSVSMVRHGMELSMLIVAGEHVDTKSVELAPLPDGVRNRKGIEPTDEFERQVVPLEGDPKLRRIVVTLRYDLESLSEEARAVMYDNGNTYDVITDNPDIYYDHEGNSLEPDTAELIGNAVDHLRSMSTLFELCRCCIFLPEFADRHEEVTHFESHPTEYAKRSLLERKQLKNDWLKADRVTKRTVTVFPDKMEIATATSVFYPPVLRIKTSGYWKTLEHNHVGADKRGNPIHGKTWVRKELTWRETHAPSSISMQVNTQTAAVEGYIYIMRSTIHSANIWKIGFSTKDPHVRSRELSSHTGVPDHFFVAKSWPVNKPREIEKEVHDQLDAFRLRTEREFFEGDLEHFINVISYVIKQRSTVP